MGNHELQQVKIETLSNYKYDKHLYLEFLTIFFNFGLLFLIRALTGEY